MKREVRCKEHPEYDGTTYIWNRDCDCVSVYRSKNPFGSPRKNADAWDDKTPIRVVIGRQGLILRLWEYREGLGSDFDGWDMEVSEKWLDAYYAASDIFREALIERMMDGDDRTQI